MVQFDVTDMFILLFVLIIISIGLFLCKEETAALKKLLLQEP